MAIHYVTAKRNDSNGVITHLETRKDPTSANSEPKTKAELIKLIKPAGSDTAKTYNKGASRDIHVVDGEYLRTDGNNTKKDNLDELPDF